MRLAPVPRGVVSAIVRAGESYTAHESELRATSIDAGGRTKKRRGWPDTDATLTVLQAQDSGDRVIATLVNFAAHPTVLRQDNLLFSRDFPGALVHGLERLLGGGGNVHAVHQVESTLIASKLLGLNETQLMNAVGSSCAQDQFPAVISRTSHSQCYLTGWPV